MRKRAKKSSAISTPIFQDPPEGIAEDWTGFLVGGMATQTNDLELARAYKQAADAVVAKALRSSDLSYEFAYPVLYLYRHAIELYLKLVVKPQKLNHGITTLARQFKHLVKTKLKQEVPDSIMERLREIADMDPKSFAFRYTKDQQGKQTFVPGEYWVRFRHLRRVATLLASGFESAYFAIGGH